MDIDFSDIGNIDIEGILEKRKKKVTVEIPNVPFENGQRVRVCILSDRKMQHLINEINASTFGQPSRPDLTLMSVGSIEDMMVTVIYYSKEKMFIFTEDTKELLINAMIQNETTFSKIHSAKILCGRDVFNCLNVELERTWRRLLKFQLKKS